jgi:formamidopyrimidine-DNA glycosylase
MAGRAGRSGFTAAVGQMASRYNWHRFSNLVVVMPELPEVETVCRGLASAMVGSRFVEVTQNRPDLRFPFPSKFASRLVGREICAVSRRAKYILVDLNSDDILVMHLGMSGSFRMLAKDNSASPGIYHFERSKNAAHDHVIFRLSNHCTIVYNDPRRFGFMQLVERGLSAQHPLFCNLGIEPLGNELDGTALAAAFAGKTAPLKAALLDQSLIAGLGNIYACEALHRAQLSPRRAAGTIVRHNGQPTSRAQRLATVIREVLMEAVDAGGSSLRDHQRIDGSLGYFQHTFRVYDRDGEICSTPGCGGTVRRIVQSGRSTFYCRKCQR